MNRRADLLWATLGEGGLILVLGAIGWATKQPLIFASLGPTAYEFVEQPQLKSARSYNIVVGHLIGMGAGFVARAFSGDKEHLISIMTEAINYKGYALVDILQPCVSFNKLNTFQWYQNRVYKLDENYNNRNKIEAIQKSMEWGDKIPLGVIYKEEKPTFHDKVDFLREGVPLVDRQFDLNIIKGFMSEFE